MAGYTPSIASLVETVLFVLLSFPEADLDDITGGSKGPNHHCARPELF